MSRQPKSFNNSIPKFQKVNIPEIKPIPNIQPRKQPVGIIELPHESASMTYSNIHQILNQNDASNLMKNVLNNISANQSN